MIEGLRRIGDDAERAGGDGLLDVAIAVGRAALHGHEDRAGLDAARVILDAGDGLGRVAGRADSGDFGDQFFPVHVVFDCSWRESSRIVAAVESAPSSSTTTRVPLPTMLPAAGACSRTVPLPVTWTSSPAIAAVSITLRTGNPTSRGTFN